MIKEAVVSIQPGRHASRRDNHLPSTFPRIDPPSRKSLATQEKRPIRPWGSAVQLERGSKAADPVVVGYGEDAVGDRTNDRSMLSGIPRWPLFYR